MTHFIRISLLENLGEMKINLYNVTAISFNKGEDNRITVIISFINGNVIKLIEDIHILDANKTYERFPS